MKPKNHISNVTLEASVGTKDAPVSDTLYVEALAAPDTIPEKTLLAFAEHGELNGGCRTKPVRKNAIP